MQFKEWLGMDEARFKGLKRMFQQEHPDMPRYVQNDLYNTRVGHAMNRQVGQGGQNTDRPAETPNSDFPATKPPAQMSPSQIMDRAGFRKDKWQQQVLQLSPADFNEKTQWHFIDRRFGFREEAQIRNDKQRTEFQRQAIAYKEPGTNEPVIMRKTNQGYELLEGWHRTMSLLLTGCPKDQMALMQSGDGYVQDFDLSKWRRVSMRAYVASGQSAPDALAGTADYVPGTDDYHPPTDA